MPTATETKRNRRPPTKTGLPVTPSWNSWHKRLANLGTIAKAAVLCGALTICLAPALGIAYAAGASTGVTAALTAFAICLVAGLNGLFITSFLQSRLSRFGVMGGMLAGMAVRMGMPLLLLIVMVIKSHPLLDGGFAYYLIGFYQVMLFVEVLLIVPRTSRTALHQQ